MPAHADPMYVFYRMKGEIQRLMYLNDMREVTEKFIEVFDKQLPKYVEAYKQHVNAAQQALTKPKKVKLTKEQEHAYSVGFANYMRLHPREESEHDAHMLRGYDVAQTKHPNRWQEIADQRAKEQQSDAG